MAAVQPSGCPHLVNAPMTGCPAGKVAVTVAVDEVTLDEDTLPQQLIDQMQSIFQKHPGYRTTHAKGLLVEGLFTPTPEAQNLSVAPHFNDASTPVIARFSVGGGIPVIPDSHDIATPKGVAIRFQTSDDLYTDMITHSFDGFAVKTGEDFLLFLQLTRTFKGAQKALEEAQKRGSDCSQELDLFNQAQVAFGGFLMKHSSAYEFVNGIKPNPFNYGTITYYQPNTHVLTNKDGLVSNVRYRLIPEDGDHLYPSDPARLARLPPNYLEDDLKQRFPGNPIIFTVRAHIAGPDDVLDDATKPYKSNTFIDVGRLEINKVSDNNADEQQKIAFSPSPEHGGVRGIQSSEDPLIKTRNGVYWISASQRQSDKRE